MFYLVTQEHEEDYLQAVRNSNSPIYLYEYHYLDNGYNQYTELRLINPYNEEFKIEPLTRLLALKQSLDPKEIYQFSNLNLDEMISSGLVSKDPNDCPKIRILDTDKLYELIEFEELEEELYRHNHRVIDFIKRTVDGDCDRVISINAYGQVFKGLDLTNGYQFKITVEPIPFWLVISDEFTIESDNSIHDYELVMDFQEYYEKNYY